MERIAKYLPSTNEFTTSQVDLVECLKIASSSPSRQEFIAEIREKYFSNNAQTRTDPKEKKVQQEKLAGNVLIGLRNYQLVNDDNSLSLTEIGHEILENEDSAKSIFGSHLFNTLCGYYIIRAMDTLKSKGISPRNKKGLAEELTLLGLKTKKGKSISTSTTDHTKFITWLKWCGFFDENLEFQEEIFRNYLGKPSGLVSALWGLSDEQHLFLKFLKDISKGNTQFSVKDLIGSSQIKYGKYIKRPDQVRADILYPLEELGFISLNRSSEGRGGNSGHLECLEPVFKLDYADFDGASDINANVDRKNKPLEQIFEELNSTDIATKGIALEELAISIGGTLGLRTLGVRTQGKETGGSEVDVLFEQLGLVYSKWLVQCKNTPNSRIDVSVVAKEVGHALILHANVVVVITTGEFTRPAHDYANQTMRKSNIQVILINGREVASFREKGAAYLSRLFSARSEQISKLRSTLDQPNVEY